MLSVLELFSSSPGKETQPKAIIKHGEFREMLVSMLIRASARGNHTACTVTLFCFSYLSSLVYLLLFLYLFGKITDSLVIQSSFHIGSQHYFFLTVQCLWLTYHREEMQGLGSWADFGAAAMDLALCPLLPICRRHKILLGWKRISININVVKVVITESCITESVMHSSALKVPG